MSKDLDVEMGELEGREAQRRVGTKVSARGQSQAQLRRPCAQSLWLRMRSLVKRSILLLAYY